MAVEPYTLAAYAVTAGAGITTAAAVAAAKWVRDIRDDVRENSRILHGEDAVDEWDGLVSMVHEHRRALRGAGLLDALRGGGPDRD